MDFTEDYPFGLYISVVVTDVTVTDTRTHMHIHTVLENIIGQMRSM